jgi:hypothetical protein
MITPITPGFCPGAFGSRILISDLDPRHSRFLLENLTSASEMEILEILAKHIYLKLISGVAEIPGPEIRQNLAIRIA